jgi:hypothetical protein
MQCDVYEWRSLYRQYYECVHACMDKYMCVCVNEPTLLAGPIRKECGGASNFQKGLRFYTQGLFPFTLVFILDIKKNIAICLFAWSPCYGNSVCSYRMMESNISLSSGLLHVELQTIYR